MKKYIAKKVTWALITLVIVSVVVFMITDAAPGDRLYFMSCIYVACPYHTIADGIDYRDCRHVRTTHREWFRRRWRGVWAR
jgi:ABC-type dipeptide/oligopeptide/nickel transport system permease component